MAETEDAMTKFMEKTGNFSWKKVAKYVGIAIAVLIFNPFEIIMAGHRGVILSFGAVSDTVLDEGIHIIIPIYQKVKEIDVRVQKSTTNSDAASKDLQQVTTSIALNFHLSEQQVNDIYQKVGLDIQNKIIDPAVQEALKAVTAKYTAEQLITQREQVSNGIKTILVERLSKYGLIMDEFSILDFRFSKAFNEAIEAKQTAEQNALRAERDIERVKNEAKARIAKAQAEAEELRLKRQQLTPLMVQKEWIEKWDGKLPTFVGGENANFLMSIDRLQK